VLFPSLGCVCVFCVSSIYLRRLVFFSYYTQCFAFSVCFTISWFWAFGCAVLYPMCGLLGVLFYMLFSGFWFIYIIGRARRRRFHAHGAFCRFWHAVRRASLFAPLKHRLSRSPAKPFVRRVPAHIALHLFVSTHIALRLFVSTHIALCRRVRTLHTLPTQPSVRHARFLPDEDLKYMPKG
jgi:hypothetical protein